MNRIHAVILDWAGTTVDFGSFAPTQIFVEAFRQAFDVEITLAEARVPMGLGKWQHIEALGKLPTVDARWQAKFGRAMSAADIDAIYAAFMPLQIAKVVRFFFSYCRSYRHDRDATSRGYQDRLLLRLPTSGDGALGSRRR
ncbi:phosphonoacetaldehyde hydrolase [Salmonella enterica subsp. enterica]|uniref:phosphonoacetaldehyde hydrolase n=1 Tax=Salmonella enterica I TaxID=59201 RepID=A0A3S4I7A7_SALET|nr:phosphonoacetaldehyde hydrolase [Salmonella enterica subsp. enterica]